MFEIIFSNFYLLPLSKYFLKAKNPLKFPIFSIFLEVHDVGWFENRLIILCTNCKLWDFKLSLHPVCIHCHCHWHSYICIYAHGIFHLKNTTKTYMLYKISVAYSDTPIFSYPRFFCQIFLYLKILCRREAMVFLPKS